ncbi:MAG: ABC transporter substrate-binding protein [Ktedonobacteraceae bacterium]
MFKAHRVRSIRWLSIVSCMVLLLAGLSACAQDQSTSTSTGPVAFTNPNPITIGFTVSLTAKSKGQDFTQDGQLILQGYQLWADSINNSGGILGRPVKLVYLDDKSDEATTAQGYTTLIQKDKVDLLFGPFSTLLTKAAEGANGISAYPFVEGAGGAPSVFTDPDTGKNPRWTNIFAVSVPVVNNLDTYAYYILSLPLSQRPKTVAYLSSDDPFTFPQIDRAEQLLAQGGVKTVFPTPANFKQYYSKDIPQFQYGPQYEYGEGDNNATAEATANAEAIVKANPDIVVLGTLLPDIQAEIAVFKKEHFKPKSLIATAGPDLGSDFIRAIGGEQYTEGIFVPNGWYPQANNFQNAEMVQAYIAKYGGTANQVNADVAEAYSVGQVTQQAIEKVGSLDKAKLISELHSGDVFNTVQGTASFAADGHNTQGLAYLFQWQGGQLIPVYPLSVAAENPEFDNYGF